MVYRQGASVETLLEELNRAKEKYEAVERDWRQMLQLNRILRASLNVRFSRWQEFRRHIALRCKYIFQYHLSQRGFFGKVLFDHSKQTLQLKVCASLWYRVANKTCRFKLMIWLLRELGRRTPAL